MNEKSLFVPRCGIFEIGMAGARPAPNSAQPDPWLRNTIVRAYRATHLAGPPSPRPDSNRRRRRSRDAARSSGRNPARLRSCPAPSHCTVTHKDAPHADSLPRCNANASFCMRLCTARSSHFYRAKFILKLRGGQRSIVAQTPAMMPRLSYEKGKVT
jgi:hypothetical protein